MHLANSCLFFVHPLPCRHCSSALTVDLNECCGADNAGSRVKSFAANSSCRLAVIVLFDSTVTVWDTSSMECVSMLQSWGDRDAARVHSGGVNAAYLTPDGTSAVTVSKDHTARVWNVTTAECRCVLRGETQSMQVYWHVDISALAPYVGICVCKYV